MLKRGRQMIYDFNTTSVRGLNAPGGLGESGNINAESPCARAQPPVSGASVSLSAHEPSNCMVPRLRRCTAMLFASLALKSSSLSPSTLRARRLGSARSPSCHSGCQPSSNWFHLYVTSLAPCAATSLRSARASPRPGALYAVMKSGGTDSCNRRMLRFAAQSTRIPSDSTKGLQAMSLLPQVTVMSAIVEFNLHGCSSSFPS
mmetsp:Transcript_128117/g.226979  ORF Transcript_128117/g.226979 Transcript_128117/m.226979 type:complete len:203 (-) Transcript_128117:680-1288(-)